MKGEDTRMIREAAGEHQGVRTRGERQAGRGVSTGWRVVQAAAAAAAVLDAVQIPISARSSSASIAGAVAAALAGIVLIRLLVAYGAWYRARWAAWTGGILAV